MVLETMGVVVLAQAADGHHQRRQERLRPEIYLQGKPCSLSSFHTQPWISLTYFLKERWGFLRITSGVHQAFLWESILGTHPIEGNPLSFYTRVEGACF